MRGISLAILLAACHGGGSATGADANDGAHDGNTPGVVSVTVQHGGAGTPVIFLAADDSVVLMTTTDANGHAEATMAPGGSVNVFIPTQVGNGSGHIYTFADVDVGDSYTLVQPASASTPTTTTVSVPAFTGATRYAASSPCGALVGNAATFGGQLWNCGATTDLYVTAQSSTQTLAAFLAKNVAVGQTISLAAEQYVEPSVVMASVTNAPAGITPLIRVAVIDGSWELASKDCGAVSACQVTVLPVAGGALGLAFQAAKDRGTQTFMGSSPFAAQVTGDVAANMMPWITNIAIDAADAKVTWTESANEPIAIDGVIVETYTSEPAMPNPIFRGRYTSVRHGGARAHIPRLPAPYDTFNLTASSMVGELYTVGSATYAQRRLDILGGALDKTLFARYAIDGYEHVGLYY